MAKKEDKPEIFTDDSKAQKMLKNPHIKYVDVFFRQLQELFFIKNTNYVNEDKDIVYKSNVFKNFIEKNKQKYLYVYFPWNKTLIKNINKKDYFDLRTNRNQDLITKEEQIKLSKVRIGIFGMSVGSNIVRVLTQAGIANSITISDFDELDTTNLNRILAGVHQIGMPKVTIMAQSVYENNPFAKITVLPHGVNKKNIESLLKQKKLDIIIDEVDNMIVKIDMRILAQKYKIPVVMVTDNGEGIVLHVERYDLAHRKIFGKEQSYFQSLISSGFTKEKVAELIISDIVGGVNKVDKKMHQSVLKVLKNELVSWPQLGSAAILAGVMATYIIKQIILGHDKRLDIRGHINPLEIKYGKH